MLNRFGNYQLQPYDPRAPMAPMIQAALAAQAQQQQQPAPPPSMQTAMQPRLLYGQNFVGPGGGGVYGGGGAYGQHERDLQAYGRGQAPATVGNMLGAVHNAMGILGGTGAITTGLGSMLGQATGLPGIGLHSMTGYIGPTLAGRAILAAGGTLAQAQAADRHVHDLAQAQASAHEMSHIDAGRHGGSTNRGGGDSLNQGNAGARGGKEKV